MRLTLRTLLAYLDDMLEPHVTKQIGQKVAESDSAQELIARIKQVTRRRRLTTPEDGGAAGKAVDPNVVAAYLDNTLPPEQVAILEKTCLESDVHLAEVAACHQILTLILGEPAHVPPPSRQRMYGLIKGRESLTTRQPPAAKDLSDAFIDLDDETEDAGLLGLPLYRGTGSWTRRLAPAAAILVILCGLALLLYLTITSGRPGSDVAEGTPSRPGVPSKESSPDQSSPLASTPTKAPEEIKTPQPEPTRLTRQQEELLGIPTVTGLLAMRPALSPMHDFFLGLGEEEAPPPPPRPRQPLSLPKETGVLRKVGDDWKWVRPQSPLVYGDLYVSLPGYQSEVGVGKVMRLDLMGNVLPGGNFVLESAVSFKEEPAVDLDLTLSRGRIIVTNLRNRHVTYVSAVEAATAMVPLAFPLVPPCVVWPDLNVDLNLALVCPQPDGESLVRVHFFDQVWDLKLLEPTSRVGLELTGQLVRGQQGPWTTQSRVFLLTTGGAVDLKSKGKVVRIPAGYLVHWDPKMTEPFSELFDLGAGAGKPRGEPIPTELRNALDSFLKRLVKRVEGGAKEFPLIDRAFKESLQENPRWEQMLALSGYAAVDELLPVVKVFDSDAKPGEVREAAFGAIANWLGRQPDPEAFRNVLQQKGYSKEEADLFVRFVKGGEDPGILVNYLDHKSLALRQLAFLNLLEFIPPGQRPPPYDPVYVNDAHVKEWKTRFPPKEKPSGM